MVSEPKKSRDLCSGCENNFYNGNNDYGVKQCWSYSKNKVVKKLRIRVDQCPPYNKENTSWMLGCFNRKGMCYPAPDNITSEGYWK
jgi:hypothetical protein